MSDDAVANILIIDDDAEMRSRVAEYMEDSGFDIIQATNGEEGIQKFRDERPDLIVSDLEMPVKDGFEVLTTVSKESSDTPVMIVSGSGMVEHAIEALRLGAVNFLPKPISDLAVLEHAICKALERSRLVEENKRYREALEVSNNELKRSLGILEEDQEAGRNVQLQLLPEKNIKIGQYHFTHQITPSLFLSGDFVDYFRIDEKHCAVYIADVSGHGASSAFVTVLLKSLMNQYATRFQAEGEDLLLHPEKLLSALSKEILNAKLGKYITMVYGLIDFDKDEMTYSIGGHFPNPAIKIDGKTHYLEGNGFPVGIFDGAKYESHQIKLPETFTLAMFSDGILEILPEAPLKEKENQILHHLDEKDISMEGLSKKLGLDVEVERPDDVTLLFISREP